MAIDDPQVLSEALLPPAPAVLYWCTLLARTSYYDRGYEQQSAVDLGGSARLYDTSSPDPSLVSWLAATYPGWTLYVIAGTPPNYDTWTGNILGSQEIAAFGYPGRVHNYFQGVAGRLRINMRAVMGTAWPGERVFLVGHSLGGAAAQLLAWLLRADGARQVLGVCTFGAPRVGDLEYATAQPWTVCRLRNRGDPVGQLPPTTAQQLGELAAIPRWGPCDHYVPAGDGYDWTATGDLTTELDEVPLAIILAFLGSLQLSTSPLRTFPHQIEAYALRCRRWIGSNWPPARTFGLDVEAIDAQQRGLAQREGFPWVV